MFFQQVLYFQDVQFLQHGLSSICIVIWSISPFHLFFQSCSSGKWACTSFFCSLLAKSDFLVLSSVSLIEGYLFLLFLFLCKKSQVLSRSMKVEHIFLPQTTYKNLLKFLWLCNMDIFLLCTVRFFDGFFLFSIFEIFSRKLNKCLIIDE